MQPNESEVEELAKVPLKIMQTRFGTGNGNCAQAAVASLLHLKLEDVPNFVSHSGLEWWDSLYAWCLKNNYGLILIDKNQKSLILNTYGIAVAKVKGIEDETHAVVMKYTLGNKGQEWTWDAEIYHDPNPNKPELVDFLQHFFIIPSSKFATPPAQGINEEMINEIFFEKAILHQDMEGKDYWNISKQDWKLVVKAISRAEAERKG